MAAAPGFPRGLGCPHQTIPVERAVKVLHSFSVYRLGKMQLHHDPPFSNTSLKLILLAWHYFF
jgi:hypothetical protein